jgi:hypothetical protein
MSFVIPYFERNPALFGKFPPCFVNYSAGDESMIQLCNLKKASLFICLCLSHPAESAEFKKTPTKASGPDLIQVVGDLASGDDKKFVDVALSSAEAVVVFHSPGGNLFAGMEIGRAIRLKGFSTLVPDNMLCASACALAWLGGRVRLMSDTGRVGFHAAYTDDNGQANVSSAGNAIVGAYLNQLGLPTSAILYITDSPPNGIQWLSFADAQRFGIDVRLLNLSPGVEAGSSKTKLPPSEVSSQKLVDAIKNETQAIFVATNSTNAEAIGYLQSKYADEVNYFGKISSKSAVLSDKMAFFRKWPQRNYSLKLDALKIDCATEALCKSEGVIGWNVSGPQSTSLGSASFAFTWTAVERGNWKISIESSQVISRKVSRSVRTSTTSDRPLYHLDKSGSTVVSLSNLYPDQNCSAEKTTGKIAKREFAKDGLSLSGVVIEEADGSREYPSNAVQAKTMERRVVARANTRPIPRRGLSREESAAYFGISPSKFDELRKDGRIGPPRLIDGRKVWDVHDLNRDFEAFPVEREDIEEDWNSAV